MRTGPTGGIEERIGAIFIDGARCEVWVRSEPDDLGTWHNALLFSRDGRPGGETLITGVAWHVPPGMARERAEALPEQERIALFRRAARPRPPVV